MDGAPAVPDAQATGAGTPRAAEAGPAPAEWAPELWRLENLALHQPASQSSISRYSRPDDAAGAVNGTKTGSFGFHTAHEEAAWWRVDLGAVSPIEVVLVWNREDSARERARNLVIEASEDGEAWHTLGRSGPEAFGGARSLAPLVVPCRGLRARHVRIRKTEPGYLHLDEVEVFGFAEPFERRALRAFCERIGESFDVAWAPRPHDPVRLRFYGPRNLKAPVRSLTLRHYGGRFGNKMTQLVHGIHVARLHGIGRIHLNETNPAGLTADLVAGGIEFRVGPPDQEPGADLHARFFYRSQLPNSFARLDAEAMRRIAEEQLRPMFRGRFPVAPAAEVPTLHIHMRAGDIFQGNGHRLYVQPPLGFYAAVIEDARRRLGIERVTLVYEDRGNPCVDGLLAWLAEHRIPCRAQSSSLDEDVGELLAAEHLVTAFGTFAFPLFLLGERLRHVYAFRELPEAEFLAHRGVRPLVVEDLAGAYIRKGFWANTLEQRQMMLDYPADLLKVPD